MKSAQFDQYLSSESRGPMIVPRKLPAFKNLGIRNNDLKCRGCGAVIIDGYEEGSFVDISFKCPLCLAITTTPGFPVGMGIDPRGFVTLRNERAYGLDDTVTYSSGGKFCANSALQEKIASLMPNNAGISRRELFSLENLEPLKETYENYTKMPINETISRVARFPGDKREAAQKFPLAWAIWRISVCIDDGFFDLNDPTVNLAFKRLMIFERAVETWSHQPWFGDVCGSELNNPQAYQHFSAVFMAADIFARNGIFMGWNESKIKRGPSPDFWLQVSPGKNFFVEVKSPKALQAATFSSWNRSSVEGSIRAKLKSSRQIKGGSKGAYLFYSDHPSRSAFNDMSTIISNLMKVSGRKYQSLYGVYVLWQQDIRIKYAPSPKELSDGASPTFSMDLYIQSFNNPHVRGSEAFVPPQDHMLQIKDIGPPQQYRINAP